MPYRKEVSVKRKTTMLLATLLLMILSGCGKDNSVSSEAIQTDAPHTFAGYPVVYLTSDVSAQGLLSAYEALEPPTDGMIGIKLSETVESNFAWADLTEELIQSTGASTIENDGAETELTDYDSTIFLTHFEPHNMACFCGTVAHLASISGQQDNFGDFTNDAEMLMKHLAEQGNTVAESLNNPVLYIAVLDHWSIGDSSYKGNIVSSYDPVSLDQACVDLVNMTEECQSLAAHIAVSNGIYTLVNAEQIGWGSRTYAFLSIDLQK